MAEMGLKEIKKDDLPFVLGIADSILSKNYLANLSNCEMVTNYEAESIDSLKKKLNSSVRFFEITQIVLNKNENMRDKLATVFNAVGNTGASLLMQIKGTKDKVEIRIGVKNPNGDSQKTGNSQNVLENSLLSNFPGIKLPGPGTVLEKVLNENDFSAKKTIAAVTDIAGLRSDEESKEKQFVQGIEKLIDAMRGKDYTLLLIADPVTLSDLNENRRALEDIYTQLVPFSSSQYSIGENESEGINESISIGASDTITKSLAKSVSHTIGKSFTETTSSSKTETNGTSYTETNGTSSNTNINSGAAGGLIGGGIGFAIAGPIGAGIGGAIGGGLGGLVSFSKGKSHSVSKGTNNSVSYSSSQSVSHGSNESDTEGTTVTRSDSHTDSLNLQTGTQKQIGESKNLQISFENHTVKKIMERIDKLLERYDTCADLGMWNCAMYCISDNRTAQMAASVYRSLIRGKNSSLESSYITVWTPESNKTPCIIDALRHFEHPKFKYGNLVLTPGTLISSSELAIHAGLPNHSVPGLPVLECAEFGRTVSSYDELHSETFKLGNIFNMHTTEDLSVDLSLASLTSHTFITGSTGSGKSNTVYKMLSELKLKKIKFLVIEPAKGEYKNEFGKYADMIYGTNPNLTPLLRINPFSFDGDTHVLEHLDRLIEIFNVCWPMYAAMPAVLKEAVEKSYEDCGWNLAESKNKYDYNLFPSFIDVTRNIKTIIDSSDYDAENKGAYKGSLVTRLKSLTNGINGQIFTTDEISNEELFDKNVIVDLSRVGSTETKSLIMGLLVLKLQEYRMNQGSSQLKHVTVLEEAHNLLKRTSTEQSSESANLLGKSVEMLTNSIAEMRSFGEGFIIADQSPGLLDMAVIRNTNTKIIMRLPDQTDRELVGKAANLNDDQITELAKLPCGVAAVYQNEWVEAVLCKVDEFNDKGNFANRNPNNKTKKKNLSIEQKLSIAKLLFNGTKLPDTLVNDLPSSNLSARSRAIIEDVLLQISNGTYEKKDTNSGIVFAELYNNIADTLLEINKKTSNPDELLVAYNPMLVNEIQDENLRKKIFTTLIVNLFINELHNFQLLEDWNNRYRVR